MATDECKIDIDTAKVCDLKRYLRHYGLPVSGSKSELILRVKGAQEVPRKPLCVIQSEDEQAATTRRAERLVSPLGEDLPDQELLKSGWDQDVAKIPSVTDNELYNYLVLNNSRTFDNKATNAKRQLKAKVFYSDRHVHSLEYHVIEDDISHCYVRSSVIPSLPTQNQNKQPDYRVWVCLAKVSGQVHAAGCTCNAGEGESCNHIAALLYALVDITSKKKEGLNAVTSQNCLWNKPRSRKLSPKKSQDLVFKKQKFDHKPVEPKVHVSATKPTKKPTIEPVNINAFSDRLKSCNPHAAFLLGNAHSASSFPRRIYPQEHVTELHSISFMYRDGVDVTNSECVAQFEGYFQSLSCDSDMCDKIETATRGQATNKAWKTARNGRLTASNFGRIIKKREETCADNTVKTVLGYTEFDSASVKWGRTHEPAARRCYVSNMRRKHHSSVCVKECGLLVNPAYPHLGASPDGIVYCKHCPENDGLLEIKCPYKYRNKTPMEAAQEGDFFCCVDCGIVKLKTNHNYYYQVQGQMAVSGKTWCDFYVWTLKGYSLQRIHFDAKLWASMLESLNTFYMRFVIPELFTDRIKRQVQNVN